MILSLRISISGRIVIKVSTTIVVCVLLLLWVARTLLYLTRWIKGSLGKSGPCDWLLPLLNDGSSVRSVSRDLHEELAGLRVSYLDDQDGSSS